MRELATILSVALLLGACAQAPKKFVPGSTAGVHTSISETNKHVATASSEAAKAKAEIAKAKSLGKGNDALQLSLDAANGHIDALTRSLLEANKSNSEAETKLVEADKKTQTEFDRANKMAAKYDIILTKYHRLKFPLCLLGAAVVGFFLWKFKVPLLALGWIGIGIMVASPLTVFGLLWYFL